MTETEQHDLTLYNKGYIHALLHIKERLQRDSKQGVINWITTLLNPVKK